MIAASTVTLQGELTSEQQTLQVFSQEILGIDLIFFQGVKELHGRYDRDNDRLYVNQKAEVSMDWVMWHEARYLPLRTAETEEVRPTGDAGTSASLSAGGRGMGSTGTQPLGGTDGAVWEAAGAGDDGA